MRIERSAIDTQLREIGEGESWWEQREFRTLPFILSPDEKIQGISTGLVGFPRALRLGRWLLVVTNQRLLCLKQDRFARRQVDIPLSHIRRLNQSNRLRSHRITIETFDRKYRLRIAKSEALRFGSALSSALPQPEVRRLPSDLEPLAWIPGINTVATLPVVGGIVSKVSMLSPPDYATRSDIQRIESRVETLQDEVTRLQEQVEFLEGLLQKRAEEAFLPPVPTKS
jgi:hypothetical protein